jgi:hypothetical protein
VIRDAGEITGAFFLGRRRLVRHRVLPSSAAFVNATGRPIRDELCIEHNGILGRECTLAKLIELLPDDWDELFLPGVDRDAFRELDVPPGYRRGRARSQPVNASKLAFLMSASVHESVSAPRPS